MANPLLLVYLCELHGGMPTGQLGVLSLLMWCVLAAWKDTQGFNVDGRYRTGHSELAGETPRCGWARFP